jgi:hypothetical protein
MRYVRIAPWPIARRTRCDWRYGQLMEVTDVATTAGVTTVIVTVAAAR